MKPMPTNEAKRIPQSKGNFQSWKELQDRWKRQKRAEKVTLWTAEGACTPDFMSKRMART